MEEDDIFESDELYMDEEESSFVEDKDEADNSRDEKVGTVVGLVEGKYYKAEKARYTDELRWIRAYQNYRGVYGSDVQFTSTEKSKVFVKVTKTKVLAAYGQIVDVLFGSNKFPISINPTVLPEGITDTVNFETDSNMRKAQESDGALPDDDTRLQPGETIIDLRERLGAIRNKLEPVKNLVEEGPGTTPSKVTFHPAMVAAKKMEKKIHDQLEESNARKQLRIAAFETALFGTGIMKGPFAYDKEYPSWSEDGEYTPTVKKTVPQTSSVSIWNFYPDPDANNMDEAEYVVERQDVRSQMRNLKEKTFLQIKRY